MFHLHTIYKKTAPGVHFYRTFNCDRNLLYITPWLTESALKKYQKNFNISKLFQNLKIFKIQNFTQHGEKSNKTKKFQKKVWKSFKNSF